MACAIVEGHLQCVSEPAPYPYEVPVGEFVDVTMYHFGGLALDAQGYLSFWDDGEYPGEHAPVLDGPGWSAPRGQGGNICVVDSQGKPTCWGGTALTMPAEPVLIAAPGTVDICFLLESGSVECARENPDWQGTPTPEGRFVEVENTYASFGCGVREDTTLACWGWHYDGQIEEDRPIEPRDYPDGDGWHDLTCRMSHCCAFQGDELECWGAVDEADYLDVPPRPE